MKSEEKSRDVSYESEGGDSEYRSESNEMKSNEFNDSNGWSRLIDNSMNFSSELHWLLVS